MTQDQKRALLKVQLQMPIIVRDVLSDKHQYDDITAYALNDMISNYSPDHAILSCALAMKEVAAYEGENLSDLSFLHMECDRLTERYTARIELAEDNPELWEETQSEMMHDMAEDLEGFIELISLCQLSFDVTNPTLADITQIMSVQLQSQLMIIDQVIELLDEVSSQTHAAHMATSGYMADNVVMFPG
ncbi:MAG: hypothetical protein ACRBDL_10880 [Alphaproteobacteria bacterium]